MQGTEFKADSVRVYEQDCVGCKRFNSDVMLTVITHDKDDVRSVSFTDIFLSTKQTEKLISDLQTTLNNNRNTRDFRED